MNNTKRTINYMKFEGRGRFVQEVQYNGKPRYIPFNIDDVLNLIEKGTHVLSREAQIELDKALNE